MLTKKLSAQPVAELMDNDVFRILSPGVDRPPPSQLLAPAYLPTERQPCSQFDPNASVVSLKLADRSCHQASRFLHQSVFWPSVMCLFPLSDGLVSSDAGNIWLFSSSCTSLVCTFNKSVGLFGLGLMCRHNRCAAKWGILKSTEESKGFHIQLGYRLDLMLLSLKKYRCAFLSLLSHW